MAPGVTSAVVAPGAGRSGGSGKAGAGFGPPTRRAASDRVGEEKCTRFPYRPADTRRVARRPKTPPAWQGWSFAGVVAGAAAAVHAARADVTVGEPTAKCGPTARLSGWRGLE